MAFFKPDPQLRTSQSQNMIVCTQEWLEQHRLALQSRTRATPTLPEYHLQLPTTSTLAPTPTSPFAGFVTPSVPETPPNPFAAYAEPSRPREAASAFHAPSAEAASALHAPALESASAFHVPPARTYERQASSIKAKVSGQGQNMEMLMYAA